MREQLADKRPRAFLERPLHPELDKEPRTGQSRSLGLARNREAALQRGVVNTPKCPQATSTTGLLQYSGICRSACAGRSFHRPTLDAEWVALVEGVLSGAAKA
jgi:hypothetical protein